MAAFLRHGGQRGPQRKILREGTYALNTAQFVVVTSERVHFLSLYPTEVHTFEQMAAVIAERGGFEPVVIKDAEDVIGIVTVHDGPSLPDGQIIAPTRGDDAAVPALYHNNFQDPEKFLGAGGLRGRQLPVPTTNFILKWNKSETGSHRYDENLSEVLLITKDAFEPSLPLSVVVHIDYTVIGVVRAPEWSFGGFTRSFAHVYVPMGPAGPAEELAVRVRGDPEQARQALLDRLIRIDPALGDVVTLKTIFGVQEHLLTTGFRASLVIGALALVLTLSGLFAVLSYLVARRTTEIGVRIALGATTRNVARLVLLQSLRAVAIGLLAGAALAGGVAKLLMSSGASSQISELVDVYDPVAYGASLFVVVIACLLAASLPALRASRIDPGTILKQE